jgi:AcrR family transcriptional regulator
MGIAERKEREKERKRAMMLEAAEELILEKGLDSLNMDEVAERAEVSKGSLYQYFNNKTDLVLGICDKATTLLSNEIQKVLTLDLPGIKLVNKIGATFLSFVGSHPEYFRAMRFQENLKEENIDFESEYMTSCKENSKSSFTCMVRAIQIGMQDGTIKTEYDPKQLAALLWSTSHGMVTLMYRHQNIKHFNLLEELGIKEEALYDGYMKLVGSGMATRKGMELDDSESFFETNGNK